MQKEIKEKAKKGAKWVTLQQVITQPLNYFTLFVLAMFLTPEDFGLHTNVAIILGFITTFQDFGIGSVMIRIKNLSQSQLSTFFWFLLLFSIVISVGLFFFGSIIVDIFLKSDADHQLVTDLLLVQASTLFLAAIGLVFNTLLLKELKFKEKFFVDVLAIFIGSVVSIYFAYQGYGVWSLVIKQIIIVFGMSIGAIFYSRWIPSFSFNYRYIKAELHYSSYLSLSMVANYFVRNIDYFLIGKFLGTNALGQYTVAYKLMLLPMKSISGIIVKILYPTLAKMTDSVQLVQRVYLKTVFIIALLSFPMMAILCGVAVPFVEVFFGDGWTDLSALILILGWVGAAQSTTSPVGVLFQLAGRTNHMLYFTFFSAIVVTLAVVVGLHWGIYGVAIAFALSWILIMFPLSNYIPFQYFDIKIGTFFKQLLVPFLSGLISFAVCFLLVEITPGANVFYIILISLIGGFAYLGSLKFLFKISLIKEVRAITG